MRLLAASVVALALGVVVTLVMVQASSANAALVQEPAWETAAAIYEDPEVVIADPDVAQDSAGNVHAIWSFYKDIAPGDRTIMYAFRTTEGAWSAPVMLPDAGTGATRDPTLLINIDDTVHVLWTTHNPDVYTVHTYRLPGGNWQNPEILPYGREDVNARVAPDGTLHVMDRYSNTHLWLPMGGSWLTETVPINIRDFEVDSQNTIHAIGSQAAILVYGYKQPGAPWVTETTTYTAAAYPAIAVGPDDGVHVAWLDEVEYPCQPSTCTRYDLVYGRVDGGGLGLMIDVDSRAVEVDQQPFQLEAAGNGVGHLIWQDVPLPEEVLTDTIRYAERLGNGTWGLRDARPGDLGRMAVAWNGDVHVLWRDSVLQHQWRQAGSGWSATYEPNNAGFDILWAGGVDVAPGNRDAPDGLHALHLLFSANQQAVYNVFRGSETEPIPATAGFAASATSGRAPLLVQFTNQSTGDFDTCQWSFGDGGTSNDCANPSHTYSSPGIFDVSLTVSGAGGTDTYTEAEYVDVFYALYLPLVVGNNP